MVYINSIMRRREGLIMNRYFCIRCGLSGFGMLFADKRQTGPDKLESVFGEEAICFKCFDEEKLQIDREEMGVAEIIDIQDRLIK